MQVGVEGVGGCAEAVKDVHHRPGFLVFDIGQFDQGLHEPSPQGDFGAKHLQHAANAPRAQGDVHAEYFERGQALFQGFHGPAVVDVERDAHDVDPGLVVPVAGVLQYLPEEVVGRYELTAKIFAFGKQDFRLEGRFVFAFPVAAAHQPEGRAQEHTRGIRRLGVFCENGGMQVQTDQVTPFVFACHMIRARVEVVYDIEHVFVQVFGGRVFQYQRADAVVKILALLV